MYAKSLVKVKGKSITTKASKDRLHVTVVLHTNDKMAGLFFFFFFTKIWLLKYKPSLKILIKSSCL